MVDSRVSVESGMGHTFHFEPTSQQQNAAMSDPSLPPASPPPAAVPVSLPASLPVYLPASLPAGLPPPLLLPASLHNVPVYDHSAIFLAGFRDCAAEALKYLSELEAFSSSEPAIEGLRQHLDHRQTHLSSQAKLHDSLDDGYSSMLVQDLSMSDSPHHSTPVRAAPQHYPVYALTPVPCPPQQPLLDLSAHDSLLEEEESRDLPDLGVLAQNNPAIASVARELMDLLQEELLDQEDDEDEDFEGELEMDMEEEETDRSS